MTCLSVGYKQTFSFTDHKPQRQKYSGTIWCPTTDNKTWLARRDGKAFFTGNSSNPSALDTIFNGRITQVETGDIMTVIAQSDAIELGALVNTTAKDGHSGEIDGSLVGLHLSEPRDLMIQLLTQGSSTFKEFVALATRGAIFSENRYGIKHFGSMLFTPLTEEETDKALLKRIVWPAE